ncbi:MAG: hypothetical protein U1E56_13275 [Bauldia sp.]
MRGDSLASVALAVGLAAFAAPASAQTTAAKPATKPAAAPVNAGTWTGQAQQLNKSGSFPVKVVITASGATTEYPDQDCGGKLTRISTSGSYTLYAEKITVNAYDEGKGTGCLDGIVTLRKSGTKLLFGWVGAIDDQMITVSGALTSTGTTTPARPATATRPSRP